MSSLVLENKNIATTFTEMLFNSYTKEFVNVSQFVSVLSVNCSIEIQ